MVERYSVLIPNLGKNHDVDCEYPYTPMASALCTFHKDMEYFKGLLNR